VNAVEIEEAVSRLAEDPFDPEEFPFALRREALNHFMARLIFCSFSEDTNIFHSEGLFKATV
jgi:hypothetical protein